MKMLLKNDAIVRFLGGFAIGCLLVVIKAQELFHVAI